MRTLLGPWTLGVMLLLTAPEAMAQARPYPECTSEPTESDVAAAKGAFQAGQASFNEADYQRAITYWEDAYRRDCTAHALLLNLARAYELSGDKRQAVEALQTYLARKPESPQKDQINRRIEVLNQQIESEPAPEPAEPQEQAPSETPTTPAPPPAEPAQPAEAKPSEPGNYWLGPVILGGVGVVAAGAGVVVHAIGSSDEDTAAENCPTRRECSQADEDLGNSGIFKQKLGVGLMIGGAAAIGGGVAWYFLAKPEPKPATPRDSAPPEPAAADSPKAFVVPELGQGYAGFSVVGSF